MREKKYPSFSLSCPFQPPPFPVPNHVPAPTFLVLRYRLDGNPVEGCQRFLKSKPPSLSFPLLLILLTLLPSLSCTPPLFLPPPLTLSFLVSLLTHILTPSFSLFFLFPQVPFPSSCFPFAPFVAASVLGVTRRVPPGEYVWKSAPPFFLLSFFFYPQCV